MNSFIKGVEVERRGMRPFTFQNAKLAGGGGAVAGGASDITLTQQAYLPEGGFPAIVVVEKDEINDEGSQRYMECVVGIYCCCSACLVDYESSVMIEFVFQQIGQNENAFHVFISIIIVLLFHILLHI